MKNAIDKARELGATIKGGINWIWAIGLPLAKAEKFIAWLNKNHYEHRGIYPRRDGDSELADIRFR